MTGSAASLPLHVDAGSRRADLVLEIARGVPEGWLTISDDGHVAFAGRVGGGGGARVRLASRNHRAAVPRDLAFAFTSVEPDRFALGGIALVSAGSEADATRHRLGVPLLTLDPGQTIHFGTDPLSGALLRFGWSAVGPTGVRNFASEAGLSFRILRDAGDLTATLCLRLLPGLAVRRLIVGISLDGTIAEVAELHGEGEFTSTFP